VRSFIEKIGLGIVLLSVTAFAQTNQPGKPGSPQSEAPAAASVSTDTNPNFAEPGTDPENKLGLPLLRHLAGDQKQFWTAPKNLNKGSLKTLAPFLGFTGLLVAGDSWISKQVPDTPSQLKRSKDFSDYAVFSLIGAGAGAFALGHLRNDDRLEETGLLSGEAAINSVAVSSLFKEITRRERPYQGDGNGSFFQGGSSFPSEHSAIAWSIASVVAHEYPGPLSKLLAYGLASGVTLSRVTAQQHFPSDVVVGSALGWYFGRQIYRAHHDTQLGGSAWGDLTDSSSDIGRDERQRNPEYMASPYVPIDSWVYPAFERLAGLGYLRSGFSNVRPWTRMECARLLEEAGEQLANADGSDRNAKGLYDALTAEFVEETGRLDGQPNVEAGIDSIYTRVTGISGPPLRDSYHFGQSLVNDYGRPYSEGFNNVSGVSAHAVAGPFAFYIRGEYQHAPAFPSYNLPVQQAIASADLTKPFANGVSEVNRFDILDSLVAVKLGNLQVSFGKQSNWLGPVNSGPLLFSNNAEPMLMLKIDSVSPFKIPLLSNLLGPARTEFFIGQLDGHQFEFNFPTLVGPGVAQQPYLHGTKISFKPTENLEFGMGVTAQFAGPGLPFTWHNFLRTFYSHTSGNQDPGKRLSQADITYRIPHLRDWLTVYCDALVVDEYSPILSGRPNLIPGIYMPRIPKIPHLEFRAEGIHETIGTEFLPGYVYSGSRRYRSGYTNDGQLLGNWIGRAGRGGQAWLTYSFTPRNKVEVGYRHQEVSHDFIGGGRLVDYSAGTELLLGHNISLSGTVQYEQWRFPVLNPARQSDQVASVQLTFYPGQKLVRRKP
jgi:hypothetical protein